MPSFLDALKAAPNSLQAKLNLFLMSFNPNARKIELFLEGRNDPSFFRVHIRKIADELNLTTTTTLLGRKTDVIFAWQYLEKRFPDNPRLMFFVDKDHDELVNATKGHITQRGLFVTAYYSIENFLVSEDAIAVVLTDLWALDSSSEAIEVACQRFKNFQEAYRSVFLPWMAWILASHRAGQRPQNDDVPFSILTVNANYEPILNWNPDMFTYLARKCNVKTPPDTAAVAVVMNELETLQTKVWLRGKQELWCLIAFLNKLEQEVRDEADRLEQEVKDDKKFKPVKIHLQISPANAVELLAPRLPCPEDLNEYAKKRLEAI